MSVTATADDIVLTQAMGVLRQFSKVELDRLAYIARRDKELLQQTMTNALARAERALVEARQRTEEYRQQAEEYRQRAEERQRAAENRRRAEGAEAAIARLRDKLRSLGVDADE